MSSVASTFIVSVTDGASAFTPDSQTLVIKYVGGQATINFSSSDEMWHVALAILDATRPLTRPSAVAGNNNAGTSDNRSDDPSVELNGLTVDDGIPHNNITTNKKSIKNEDSANEESELEPPKQDEEDSGSDSETPPSEPSQARLDSTS